MSADCRSAGAFGFSSNRFVVGLPPHDLYLAASLLGVLWRTIHSVSSVVISCVVSGNLGEATSERGEIGGCAVQGREYPRPARALS
jgi:hypothetical protein